MIKSVTVRHIEALLATVVCHCHVVENTTTTVAVAMLPMGEGNHFTLATEISGCADPAKFCAETGAKYATEKAMAAAKEKLWELEGYKLACEINRGAASGDHIDRMIAEHNELTGRLVKLEAFFESNTAAELDEIDAFHLREQFHAMNFYADTLQIRLERAGCIKFTGANWPALVDHFGGGELVGEQFHTPAGDSLAPGMWGRK